MVDLSSVFFCMFTHVYQAGYVLNRSPRSSRSPVAQDTNQNWIDAPDSVRSTLAALQQNEVIYK